MKPKGRKKENFMITKETNTNKIQQKYLDTLSEINSEMEKLVNQLLLDEIQPTIEEIKQIDYNKAFKNALIERYKDSPLSKGLVVKNCSTKDCSSTDFPQKASSTKMKS